MTPGEIVIAVILAFLSLLAGLWARAIQAQVSALRNDAEFRGKAVQGQFETVRQDVERLRTAIERDMREIANWRGRIDATMEAS